MSYDMPKYYGMEMRLAQKRHKCCECGGRSRQGPRMRRRRGWRRRLCVRSFGTSATVCGRRGATAGIIRSGTTPWLDGMGK
jgi:hypothetical protein